MRNIKVTVKYDGSNYRGFQRQTDNLPTIQQALEGVLTDITKHPVIINGAGRTDAGVHALGQIINFKTPCRIPADRICLVMNRLLPKDIVALEAEEVDWSFHAQFKAKRKIYRYHIYNSRIPPAFERLYSYYVPKKLDVEAVREAAKFFVGEHDFSAFKSAESKTRLKARSPVKNICRLDIEYSPPHLYFEIEGNGFLYNMVRIISGTLLYVGIHKLALIDVKRTIETGNRLGAGPTLPPQGLYLMEVIY